MCSPPSSSWAPIRSVVTERPRGHCRIRPPATWRADAPWRSVRAAARSPFLLLLGLVLALVGACDTSSTGLRSGSSLPLAFSISLAGGAASAFDAADAIAVTVSRDGRVILDEVQSFVSGGSDVHLRVPVDAGLDGVPLAVAVELRRGKDSLFRGGGTVRPSSRASEPAEIGLEPVVAAIRPPPSPRIPAIGASLELKAAAVFATGDTIANVPIDYQLLDQGVIHLLPNGVAVGDREGTARVRASARGITVEFDVEVRIAAASITVRPDMALIGLGATIALDAAVFDATGLQLDRQPVWQSADDAIATVDASGLVTGVAAGRVAITASVDDARGAALIEVSATPPPAAPTGLATSENGTVISLSWQDNASTETAYEVHRGPSGGTLTRLVTLPPDSRSYIDGGLTEDQLFDYVVMACNGAICSASDRVTGRTVPAAPTFLLVRSIDQINSVFRLTWTDNSVAETLFNVQVFDPVVQQFVTRDDVPANTTEYQGTASPSSSERLRVRACNTAGCSAPTNVVTVDFGLLPPQATTLPFVTNTVLNGFTDGRGVSYDWWFEYAVDDPSFVDAGSSPIQTTVQSGPMTYPAFDLPSSSKVYYRIVARNSAGVTFGAPETMMTPELVEGSPSTSIVCNAGPSCSVNPSTITFTATSTGPAGIYVNPFQFVSFDLAFPSIALGSGSVTVSDNSVTGVRTYTWTLTWDPSSAGLSPGSYSVIVRGYPSSGSGNVVTMAINFIIDAV